MKFKEKLLKNDYKGWPACPVILQGPGPRALHSLEHTHQKRPQWHTGHSGSIGGGRGVHGVLLRAVTLSHTGWQDGRASVTSADISPGLSGAVSESLVHGLVSDVIHSEHTLSEETSEAQPPLKTTQLTSPRPSSTETSWKQLGYTKPALFLLPSEHFRQGHASEFSIK